MWNSSKTECGSSSQFIQWNVGIINGFGNHLKEIYKENIEEIDFGMPR